MTNYCELDDAYSARLDLIREQKGNRLMFGMEGYRYPVCSQDAKARFCNCVPGSVRKYDFQSFHYSIDSLFLLSQNS